VVGVLQFLALCVSRIPFTSCGLPILATEADELFSQATSSSVRCNDGGLADLMRGQVELVRMSRDDPRQGVVKADRLMGWLSVQSARTPRFGETAAQGAQGKGA